MGNYATAVQQAAVGVLAAAIISPAIGRQVLGSISVPWEPLRWCLGWSVACLVVIAGAQWL